jgi:replicative DNA helicase
VSVLLVMAQESKSFQQQPEFQSLVDRLPPQNIDAEEAILGGILMDPEAIGRIMDIMQPEGFYLKAHRVLFEAALGLLGQGKPTDLMNVVTYLTDKGLLDQVGGQGKLVELADRTVSAVNIDQYALLVMEKYSRRRLIRVGQEISELGHDTGQEFEVVLDSAEQKVFNITQSRPQEGLVATAEVLTQTFADIESRSVGLSMPGLACGFYDLDGMTQGFQRGDLIIAAGRPSMGKCLAAQSEIVLADGSVRTIEEVYRAQSADLLTLGDDFKLRLTQPSHFIDDGIKPLFRVRTRLGRQVETTLTHPYLTIQGWRPLGELKVGDRVAVPRRLPIEGGGIMPESEIDRLASSLVGVDGDREVPEIVFRLKKPQIARLLSQLFFVMADDRLGFATDCERIARQMQHLLLRFGVVAALEKDAVAWRLEVADGCSIQNFVDEIAVFGRAMAIAGGPLLAKRLAPILGDFELDLARKSPSIGGLGGGSASSLATSDVYWDEIVAIESIGSGQVYDLTIPDTHNFVANDVCVHNTSFVLNIARNIASYHKLPVAVFSLEMSKEQLVQRLLSGEVRIESSRLRAGRISSQEWEPLGHAISMLSQMPIYIDDTPGISVSEMRSRMRRLQAENGGALGLVIIDYLQLMETKGTDNRVQALSNITRSLKGLAREFSVPVVALSQLSRSVESRNDKRPLMSDLRESGAIEQDADLIMMLYRDEYYNKDTPDRGLAEIIINKHRNGPTGTVKLLFEPQFTQFRNLTTANREY